MRKIKLFENFDDINQNIEGILIELRDEGIINFIIKDATNKDIPGIKVIFSRENTKYDDDWLFKITDLVFEVETLEKYLIAYRYQFHYIYEYYDDCEEEESLFERCPNINHIEDLCDVAYLNLIIYK